MENVCCVWGGATGFLPDNIIASNKDSGYVCVECGYMRRLLYSTNKSENIYILLAE